MQKKYLAIALVLSLFYLSWVKSTYKSFGPPACHAGEPPNHTTCNNFDCHTSYALNAGTAELSLDLGGAEENYIPGDTYTVTVSLIKQGLMRGGFQFIALQDNNLAVSPGSFELTDLNRTQVIDIDHPHAGQECPINQRVWIEHSDGGIDHVHNDSISWQFDWQSPTTDVGNITFYVTSVEANVDLDATGDYVYSLTKTLSSTTGIDEKEMSQAITIHPNPVSDRLYLDFPKARAVGKNNGIVIVNVSGQAVLKSNLVHSIPVQSLPAGNYVIEIRLDEEKKAIPFVKVD